MFSLLFTTFASSAPTQVPTTPVKTDMQKAVTVVNGQIMPADFNLNSIDPKTIESVNVIKPDSSKTKLTDLKTLYGENAAKGVILITLKTPKADLIEIKEKPDENKEKIYDLVEQMPEFPGGSDSLIAFIHKNIKTDSKTVFGHGIPGRVIVHFVVSKTGSIDNVEIIKSLDPICDKEAIRVIKLLPKFIPGKQNGENVAVWYNMVVPFILQ